MKFFFSPEGDDLEWERQELEKIRFVLLRVLDASDEAVSWFDQWVTYCFDSIETSGVVDDRNLPEMPREVVVDIGAACARADAMDLDYERTGQVNLEPSMQSRLEVAERLAAKWKE